jgi:hypothetical protein
MLFMQPDEPPDAGDLRCEYQTSEAHIATLTSGVWQSAAIVVGGSIAAFALLIGDTDSFTRARAVAVTVLAAGAVLVIEMWRHNWKRHKWAIDNRWARMREIEHLRGMRTNICMYLLSRCDSKRSCLPEWQWLSDEERKRFPKPYRELPKLCWIPAPLPGQWILQITAILAQVGWLLMIAFAWIEAA